MDVLVTGASGLLGSALRHVAPGWHDVSWIDVEDCDFIEASMLRARLIVEAPDLIINAAALTDFKTAEADPDLAYAINSEAVAIMVDAMSETGGKVVHVSSSRVFEGLAAGRAWLPRDTPHPVSAYARSKADGEGHLRAEDLLIRTSWLYGLDGDCFVSRMLGQIIEGTVIAVESGCEGSPTWATGLARIIWGLVGAQACGTIHHCDAGAVSRLDFAVALAEEAFALGLIDRMAEIHSSPVGDSLALECPLLDCSETRAVLGEVQMPWRDNLRAMLKEAAKSL